MYPASEKEKVAEGIWTEGKERKGKKADRKGSWLAMKADRAWPPPFTLVHRARSNRCRNDGRSFLFLDRSIGRANEFKLASKSKTRSKSLLSRAKIISSRWSETIKSRYVNWLAEWRVSRLIYPRKMVSQRQLPKPVIPEICDSLLRVSSHRPLDDSYRSYQPRFQAVSNFDRVLEKGFRKEGRKEGKERWRREGLEAKWVLLA